MSFIDILMSPTLVFAIIVFKSCFVSNHSKMFVDLEGSWDFLKYKFCRDELIISYTENSSMNLHAQTSCPDIDNILCNYNTSHFYF